MNIIVSMLSGPAHTLMVQPYHTVGHVKTLIHEKLGVPPHKQRLGFVNGHRVDLSDDSQTVCSYGLQSGSRVSLLVIEPATIQVFLRNEKGKLSTYDIKPDETVDNFKTKVQCREGVQVSQQRLIYQGREMMQGLLSEYQVEAHGTIDLNLRLRGG